MKDQTGQIQSSVSINWDIQDGRVAVFSASGTPTEHGWSGGLDICGNGTGYGYTSVSASLTDGSASSSANLEYGQTPPGLQPVSVTVTPSGANLQVQGTVQLSAKGNDQFGHSRAARPEILTWSSNNVRVATVSGTGLVTGVGGGSTSITGDMLGTPGTSAITVAGAVSITISPNPISVCYNGFANVAATAYDGGGQVYGKSVMTWSSSNTAVLTAGWRGSLGDDGHRQGTIISAAYGSATVVARLENVSASAPASVVYCPPSGYVSGPYTTNMYTTATYTANVYNGEPPFTYEFRRQECPATGSCGPFPSWTSTGSSRTWNNIVYTCNVQHVYVEARVTDARGSVGYLTRWQTDVNNPCH